MDLEVHEAKLAKEQARGMHPFDGHDLLTELEKLHACVAGVEEEHTVKAGKPSMLVKGISSALVDFRALPIRDIPQLLKTAQEVLAVANLVLEHASGTDP
jgi:hypothetical protein